MSVTSAFAYFDGACLPRNPGGTATYGWVLYGDDGGKPGALLAQGHGIACRGPRASNNRGEYGGITAAMMAALEMGIQDLKVRGDSQLIIRQLQGTYKVNSENLIEPYRIALDLARQFRRIHFEWIPRELNSQADRLSEIAYEELTGKPVPQGKPTYRPTQKGAGGKTPGASEGGAGWKDKPASEKQLRYLAALGYHAEGDLTQGEASKLIDERVKKAGPG